MSDTDDDDPVVTSRKALGFVDNNQKTRDLPDTHTKLKKANNDTQEWPSFTSLVLSRSGDVNLTAQSHEVKATIRKGIPHMLGQLFFIHGYPDHPTRLAWAKKALIAAAGDLRSPSSLQASQTASNRYLTISKRFDEDEDYWRALARLVRHSTLSLCHSDKLAIARCTLEHLSE
jgi:hypothetical protein